MIGRMAKPEEVLVVENENGEVIREQFKVKFTSNGELKLMKISPGVANARPLGLVRWARK